MRRIQRWLVGTTVLVCGMVAACDSGGDGPTGPKPVATIVITGDTSALELAQTRQLSVILRDASGTVLSGRPVTWTSATPTLATVDANGLVTAKGTGDATITASSEGASATWQVHVRAAEVISTTATTIHINPADPVLVTKPLSDGRTLQILGDRDAGGHPTRITGTRTFRTGSETPGTLVTYRADGLPSEVRFDSLGYITFDYTSPGRARVTFVLPDGNTAEAGFDLGGSASVRHARSVMSGSSYRARTASSGARLPWRRTWVRAFETGTPQRVELSPAAAQAHTVTIRTSINASTGSVTAPVGGASVVNFVRKDQALSVYAPYPAPEVSEGVYETKLTFDPAPPIDLTGLKNLCDEIDDKTSAPCDALEKSGFEPEFKAACIILTEVPAVGVALAALCEAGVVATGILCGPFVELACLAVDKAYDWLSDEAGLNVLTMAAGKDFSKSQSTHAPAPVASVIPVNITLPLLLSIRIDPADPAPYQSYVATTLTRPAIGGLAVQMGIVGTDGYTNSKSGLTSAAGTFQLFVPGATAGVHDVITATVGDQTRTASIVF